MTHLRNYIRVYDDVLDERKIEDIYKIIDRSECDTVDVDGIMRYDFKQITPASDTMKTWLALSYHFVGMLTQYKNDVGIQHEPRWSEDVMEGFTFRRYKDSHGFQETMFDSRSETTAGLFMSGIYFLNDSPDFTLEFDHSVSAYGLVQAKAGRLVVWPSSWLYPYRLNKGSRDTDIVKATMRWHDLK